MLGADAQKSRNVNRQRHNNKTVHWVGRLIAADQQRNALLIKMNPSFTNDQNRPDVILGLSKPHLVEMMQPFVGKYIDYTAKIISAQNGTVSTIFANYDIYQRPEVPQ